MSYMTQMEAAQKGLVTDKMKQVLAAERISETVLLERVAGGKIVIPANKKHRTLIGKGIGEGLCT